MALRGTLKDIDVILSSSVKLPYAKSTSYLRWLRSELGAQEDGSQEGEEEGGVQEGEEEGGVQEGEEESAEESDDTDETDNEGEGGAERKFVYSRSCVQLT